MGIGQDYPAGIFTAKGDQLAALGVVGDGHVGAGSQRRGGDTLAPERAIPFPRVAAHRARLIEPTRHQHHATAGVIGCAVPSARRKRLRRGDIGPRRAIVFPHIIQRAAALPADQHRDAPTLIIGERGPGAGGRCIQRASLIPRTAVIFPRVIQAGAAVLPAEQHPNVAARVVAQTVVGPRRGAVGRRLQLPIAPIPEPRIVEVAAACIFAAKHQEQTAVAVAGDLVRLPCQGHCGGIEHQPTVALPMEGAPAEAGVRGTPAKQQAEAVAGVVHCRRRALAGDVAVVGLLVPGSAVPKPGCIEG